jgi:arginine/lysine/ornithine decarboxylase
MDAGADICVTSIHKSGSSFEQSSVFHLQGDRIDAEVLSARADLLSTTSPCALIYAGIDGWRRQMVEQGHDLIAGAIGRATRFAEAIVQIPGIDLDLDAWRDGDGVADLDPLKICFDVWRLGLTGYDAAAWLRNERHVNLGVADHRRMMAMFSHADDEATLGKVVNALRDLSDAHDVRNEPLRTVEIPPPGELETKTAMLPRDAFYAKAEQLSLDKAAGRICAELVTPYPPGIPALAPGELIDEAHINYLRTGIDHGMYVPDSADPELNTIRVVA